MKSDLHSARILCVQGRKAPRSKTDSLVFAGAGPRSVREQPESAWIPLVRTPRDSQFLEVLRTVVAWCGDRMDNKLGYLIVLHVDVTAMYSISVNT